MFPVKALSDSESDEATLSSRVILSSRDDLLNFLQPEDEIPEVSGSDQGFYDSLQEVKRKNKQCLLELGRMYQTKLENNHNSKEDKELEDFFQGSGRLTLPMRFHEVIR